MRKILIICFWTIFQINCSSQSKKTTLTSSQFNTIYGKDLCKIYTKTDTLEIPHKYKAFIVIDSTKIKDLNKIKIFFYTVPLERKKNKFKIEYIPIISGLNSYDLTIINHSDTIRSTITFYGKKHTKSGGVDYIALAEQMPQFNSNEYTSFADYFIKSCKKENISLQGKAIIDYTVLANGSTRFEKIEQSALKSYDDEEKIEQIITNYKGWTPGMDKGKKVNVNIRDIIKF
jgi:hypothetical protein